MEVYGDNKNWNVHGSTGTIDQVSGLGFKVKFKELYWVYCLYSIDVAEEVTHNIAVQRGEHMYTSRHREGGGISLTPSSHKSQYKACDVAIMIEKSNSELKQTIHQHLSPGLGQIRPFRRPFGNHA